MEMAARSGRFPSEIVDPDGRHLIGLDRMLFDAVLWTRAAVEAKLRSGDTSGLSATVLAEYEASMVDEREGDEFEAAKARVMKHA
jgi:hypothetical protein